MLFSCQLKYNFNMCVFVGKFHYFSTTNRAVRSTSGARPSGGRAGLARQEPGDCARRAGAHAQQLSGQQVHPGDGGL
jgi:hypothetical protein